MRNYNPQSKPLPLGRHDDVKRLFQQSGWMDFLKVIESHAKLLEVEALNTLAESNKYEQYEDKSLGLIKDARKFRTALDVIKEIESETKPYSIVESIN